MGKLAVNADDWGRCPLDTDRALDCYRLGRITSASAMVFMEDSERAAMLAKEHHLDVGLHLNFVEEFNGPAVPARVKQEQAPVRAFLNVSKYSQLLYNPLIARKLDFLYHAQAEEFARLYGKLPTRVDGHRHMHLSTTVLLRGLIPEGIKVRGSFSFWPGEKSVFNRIYRNFVNRRLRRRYEVPDYFFSLSQCMKRGQIGRVAELSQKARVEVMTHPRHATEYAYLISDNSLELFNGTSSCTQIKH